MFILLNIVHANGRRILMNVPLMALVAMQSTIALSHNRRNDNNLIFQYFSFNFLHISSARNNNYEKMNWCFLTKQLE